MIIFEVVEVAVIGYHFLQVLYGLVGAALLLGALRLWSANGPSARLGKASSVRGRFA
jgi:hypothetical protein